MSEKIKKIIEDIENLTVVELNDLIKSLEDKFGVSGAFAVPTVQVASNETAKTESGTVDLILSDAGANKLNVIKILREINPNLSLKDAKDMVDNLPQKVAEKIERTKAEELKKKFEEAGAKIEIK